MKHKWRKDRNGEIDMWAWESDFHSGPVCEVCGRSVCEYCAPDWMNLDDCPGPHIITNADYIRAMRDEELAQLLVRLASCVDDMECGGCPFENSGAVCWMAEGIEKWLKAPHKENEE